MVSLLHLTMSPGCIEHVRQHFLKLLSLAATRAVQQRAQSKVRFNGHQARTALLAERARPMNQQEMQGYVQGYDRLVEQMALPGRGATSTELQVVQTLRAQAHALNAQVTAQPNSRHVAVKPSL